MKMLLVSDTVFEYQQHIFNKHIQQGIHPDELQVAATLQTMLSQATDVPTPAINLGKAQVTELGPQGVTLEIPLPGTPTDSQ